MLENETLSFYRSLARPTRKWNGASHFYRGEATAPVRAWLSARAWVFRRRDRHERCAQGVVRKQSAQALRALVLGSWSSNEGGVSAVFDASVHGPAVALVALNHGAVWIESLNGLQNGGRAVCAYVETRRRICSPFNTPRTTTGIHVPFLCAEADTNSR